VRVRPRSLPVRWLLCSQRRAPRAARTPRSHQQHHYHHPSVIQATTPSTLVTAAHATWPRACVSIPDCDRSTNRRTSSISLGRVKDCHLRVARARSVYSSRSLISLVHRPPAARDDGRRRRRRGRSRGRWRTDAGRRASHRRRRVESL